jgi:hypothetical protein
MLANYLLTSVELGGKLDLGLDLLIFILECHLCKLDAELVFACLLSLILILNIWVHITIEELRIVSVCQL